MNNLEKNKLVYTTRNILNGISKISIIYHDDDGDWQALDRFPDLDDPCLISMTDLYEIDESIVEVMDMPKGYKATKNDSKWIILKDEE